jgi:anti-sigma regulatory factor (Ser/Thr protein kinase)
MSTTLVLEPEPASVRRARHWVVEGLERLGRSELVDAAELGVSELVTNALLHAAPPITVRLGGTATHPRIEVHDNSRRPPRMNPEMAEDDQLLRTMGRGLGLVALYSARWGAEISADGKIVWFEPADEPAESVADVFDLDRTVDELLSVTEPPVEHVTVRLLGMPAQHFAAFRSWYAEMRRELRLLSLAHPEDYPLAGEIAEIALRIEQERRQSRGIDALDAAIVAGLDSVDLEYRVPVTAPATMTRFGELLEELDRFCAENRLLTMPATPGAIALRRWYLGEFARQAAGMPPIPWNAAGSP